MKIQISVPCKTFILGEYAVLKGGPGVLVGTEPRFMLEAKWSEENDIEARVESLSQQGPAFEYLKDNLDCFSNYEIVLKDIHGFKGGFGWSSAQFILLYALKQWHEKGRPKQIPNIDPQKLLIEFLQYSWNGQGWAPSGLDILSQLEGGILCVQAPRVVKANKIENLNLTKYNCQRIWPFTGIDFVLIHTGNKLATHQHLSSLKEINTDLLSDISTRAVQSLQQLDEEGFIRCVSDYRDELDRQNLVAPASLSLIKLMEQRPEVVVAKGCGALGVDVIMLIVIKDLKEELMHWLKEQHYNVVSSSESLSSGVDLKFLDSSLETDEE